MNLDPKTLAGALNGNVIGPADFLLTQALASSNVEDAYGPALIEALAASTDEDIFEARKKFINRFGKEFKYRGPGAWDSRIKEARLALTSKAADDKIPSLIRSETGSPKPILANAITALELSKEWQGVLAFNEFSTFTEAVKKPPFHASAGVWSDQHDRLTADWLQHHSIYVSVDTAGQAVQTVATKHKYHPVRDYLYGIEWDGEPRLERWLRTYIGTPDNKYTRAIAVKWIISAIARVMEPGCKADCAIILEGAQGIQKSTAMATLGGKWFTDEIADFGSKDAALQMQGAWIIELGELDQLSRPEESRIKAFMSRSTERFRPPYGRHITTAPRQCVFAGTVNPSSKKYFRDETGARRFWPVQCGRIDIKKLREDRDQLWAEALVEYRKGTKHWMDEAEIVTLAKIEQSMRQEIPVWFESISQWVEIQALDHMRIPNSHRSGIESR